MAKCLVTGGAGFIGSNLVDALVERGEEVIIIDNLSTGRKENLNPKAKFHQEDIRNLEEIKPLFNGIDFVFHLAAWPRVPVSIKEPLLTHDINATGTLNVLLAAREAKVKKVIFSSSSSVYGNQEKMPLEESMEPRPMSPYALHKYVGEQYCRLFNELYDLPTVSLRYFNVYGKRQPLEGTYALVIGIFINQLLNDKPMTITGDGTNRRDYTSVIDIVRANIMAAQSENVGKAEIINIGRGESYSVNELAQMIGGPSVYIPPRIEPKESLADNSLAKDFLGWQPTGDLPEWIKGYKKEMGLK